MLHSLKVSLTLAIILASSQFSEASGYHPFFDRAVEEAELIVLGRVTDAWYPTAGRGTSAAFADHVLEGRMYSMIIEEVYKGTLQPGQEVIFWDPYFLTTAGYFVDEGNTNLTFLVPVTLSESGKKHFNDDTRKLYRPIRNFSKSTDFGAEELNGWLYLLNLTQRNPPKDIKKAYWKILNVEDNRYILRYVIEHWPDPMTKDDESLFRNIVQTHSDDAYITSPAIDRLVERGQLFTEQELLTLLKEGSPGQRKNLLPMLNSENIDSYKEILFSWLMEEEPEAEQETIEILARLCPGYLKKQLQERDLPFWKLIPCLQALNINGSDVGKRDFNSKILALSPYIIRNVGNVFRGEEFHGMRAMENPRRNKEWLVASTLLEPLLAKPDSPTRRLVVGLMRTFGIHVKRDGPNYIVVHGAEPVSCPILLELETPRQTFKLNDSINLTIKETGLTDGIWFSFQGELLWRIEMVDDFTTYIGSGFSIWDKVDIPRDAFVKLKKGEIVWSHQKMNSLIQDPGKYSITVKKIYPHDGGHIGVDAWTGVAFSNQVNIEVIDPR